MRYAEMIAALKADPGNTASRPGLASACDPQNAANDARVWVKFTPRGLVYCCGAHCISFSPIAADVDSDLWSVSNHEIRDLAS